MTVRAPGVRDTDEDDGVNGDGEEEGRNEVQAGVKMRNHWFTAVLAVLIWTVIAAMNVANLVLLGRGNMA